MPTRDRQAVLKAIIKNEEDALELLSGHLHVLLAHKRNTLAVLELIRYVLYKVQCVCVCV